MQDHFICSPCLLADWFRLSKLRVIQCSHWMKDSSTENPVAAPSAGHDSITKDYAIKVKWCMWKSQDNHNNRNILKLHSIGLSIMLEAFWYKSQHSFCHPWLDELIGVRLDGSNQLVLCCWNISKVSCYLQSIRVYFGSGRWHTCAKWIWEFDHA